MSLRKAVCAAVAVLCVGVAAASAEVHDGAIGLRFTGGNLTAYELNYQAAVGLFGSNRLEIGANFWGDENTFTIAATGVAQWYWNISGGFNWYAGPGVGLGFSSTAEQKVAGAVVSEGSSSLYVGVGGQVGIEYDFNALGAPLNVSIDTRPMIDVLHAGGFGLNSILYGSIAVRYTF